ncbi:MAG: hypothetical protein JNL74_21565 [Fibrobacteres bacterium]|nr:hypothetical protein [Fibrobacterota bacterium]
MKNTRSLIVVLSLVSVYVTLSFSQKQLIVENPYRDIKWSSSSAWERHKANFHTHTNLSDGNMAVPAVIDSYYTNGYTILSITDHNNCTWPWTTYGRNPDSLGMIAIPGNEFSSIQHTGNLFTTIPGNPGSSVTTVYNRIVDSNGLAIVHHPGKYSYAASWYVNLFRTYPMLSGIEVFNQGNRYPNDWIKWDSILISTMPQRPVWGYSCDDMHTTAHLFKNYNILFVDTLTEASIRQSMMKGQFYFCYEPGGSGEHKAPSIDSIMVDSQAASITISAKNYTKLYWISGNTVLDSGVTVNCGKYFTEATLIKYIRAKLIGSNGETYTQPFGVDFVDKSVVSAETYRHFQIGCRVKYNNRSLSIEAAAGVKLSSFHLYDIKGRICSNPSVVSDKVIHFATSGLHEGCYLLRGLINGRQYVRTVILINE